jgi:hypothetical protein
MTTIDHNNLLTPSELAPCIKVASVTKTTRERHREAPPYYSIPELAERWRCSRGTVYNRLRVAGAKVLDFSTAVRKSKKLVPALTVSQLEAKFTKALQ